ncbi:MAG: hypothetical protein NVS1B7_7630 [Candidatus Saccharimonadales bacterium]
MTPPSLAQVDAPKAKVKTHYSIEFFHIYTDEVINKMHQSSLNYLRAALPAWDFSKDLIILIDNYNPAQNILSETEILAYLDAQQMTPRYWAFEADFVENAHILLSNLTNNKLKKNYEKYIVNHNKMPCSLLTATWYLSRLGAFENSCIRTVSVNDSYVIPTRLINILPEAYKGVELRAGELIQKSNFSEYHDSIQDLFYPASAHRKIDLF